MAYKDSNNNLTVGISNKLPLPKEVSDKVKQGQQFGRAIRDFKISTKTKSPDVIEQIEELITREKSFTSALQKAIANLPK